MGVARACGRSARARDDLVAGFGVDARPSVLERPRTGPSYRVPAGRPSDRPCGPVPAPPQLRRRCPAAAASSRWGARMSRTLWTWGRLVAPVATLAVLVWRLGTGPFLEGLRTIDGPALAAAAGLAVLTTVCCAWRWKIVAGGLGFDLPLPTAVAAYYRSLF